MIGKMFEFSISIPPQLSFVLWHIFTLLCCAFVCNCAMSAKRNLARRNRRGAALDFWIIVWGIVVIVLNAQSLVEWAAILWGA